MFQYFQLFELHRNAREERSQVVWLCLASLREVARQGPLAIQDMLKRRSVQLTVAAASASLTPLTAFLCGVPLGLFPLCGFCLPGIPRYGSWFQPVIHFFQKGKSCGW